MEAKSNRGGKRDGAGRPETPAKLRKAVVPYRLPSQILDEVKRQAHAFGEEVPDMHAKALSRGLGLRPEPL